MKAKILSLIASNMYMYLNYTRVTKIIYFLRSQELVRELGDGAFVGTLASDSSNVVTLVEDLYNVRLSVMLLW